jgi:predicted nuclease of predicted toxin-antitoxin system
MIYLIDNQLPLTLARHLQLSGLEATHVSELGLEHAEDRELWDYAKVNECAIVSKDQDFLYLSASDPDGPPFVWVRLGNCRNSALLGAFDAVLPQLLSSVNAGAKVIEIR